MPVFPDIEKSSWRIGRIPLEAASGFLQRDDLLEEEQEIPCAPGIKRLHSNLLLRLVSMPIA